MKNKRKINLRETCRERIIYERKGHKDVTSETKERKHYQINRKLNTP